MKIKKFNREVEVRNVVSSTVAVYTPKDIVDLIKRDLIEKGHHLKGDIKFTTKWKYKSDDWGMNRHVATEFTGAEVEVQE